MAREPRWLREEEDGWRCTLCPQACLLSAESPSGLCRVRGLVEGEPALPGYGRCVSLAIDPVEKKPLYHFLPGSSILSTGPAGCNLSCRFCQNWTISQTGDAPTRYVDPHDLADLAMSQGSAGVAFTYTEPTIWFEYIEDTAPLVRSRGGAVVMVSNGYVNPKPLRRYLELTDAWNVDLKAWSDDFYTRLCGGHLKPVMTTIETIAASPVHLEVTLLIIPGENDAPEDWRGMAEWLAEAAGPGLPVHLSRYFPRYRHQGRVTPESMLVEARGVFSEYLHHVYLGNVGSVSDTLCPACGAVLVSRSGYRGRPVGVDDGRCVSCGGNVTVVDRLSND
jgi:pyruvate formate lyase activating enzyme